MTESVTYSRDGDIAVITIDNPPVNALSAAVRAGIDAAMAEFAADDAARAAVICAAGRTFIAGADITEFGKPPRPPALPDLIDRIEAAPKPVVAAIHGTPLGGGLEVALGAHWRVALAGTQMGLPEVTIGVMPGAGGTQRMPRLVGLGPAIDIITTGRRVPAAEALDLGLIDEIAAGVDARAAGIAFARRLLDEGRTDPRPVSQMQPPAPDSDLLAKARAGIERRNPGEVAQLQALSAIEGGLTLPFAEGMAQERAGFTKLLDSPQRAALIHAFFADRRVTQNPDLKDVAPRALDRIGVIGGGTMGAGIATSALLAGLTVTLIERDAAAAARARDTVAGMLAGAVKRGKLDPARRDAILSDAFGTSDDYAALTDADLVIEAVFEKIEVKDEVFRRLDAVCRPGAILATNTSYLDVGRIAAATSRPEDVIGLHFFSPAHVMKLLEIVVPDGTAKDVVATAFALAKRLGKVPVRAGVCDGFIGNRMMNAYRSAADHMVLDGASPYQIDCAVRDFGFAMGPYQVSDLAGLDIAFFNRQRKAATRDARERVPVFADRLVEAGRLGRKAGRGYYIYDETSPNGRPDPEMDGFLAGIRSELGITPRDFTDQEIVDRYLAAMVNEGARIVGEGIAQRPSDVDVTKLYGYGFPRWRGGPMHVGDVIGAGVLRDRINEYAKADPYFWQVAPLIEQLADDGGRFDRLNTAG